MYFAVNGQRGIGYLNAATFEATVTVIQSVSYVGCKVKAAFRSGHCVHSGSCPYIDLVYCLQY